MIETENKWNKCIPPFLMRGRIKGWKHVPIACHETWIGNVMFAKPCQAREIRLFRGFAGSGLHSSAVQMTANQALIEGNGETGPNWLVAACSRVTLHDEVTISRSYEARNNFGQGQLKKVTHMEYNEDGQVTMRKVGSGGLMRLFL